MKKMVLISIALFAACTTPEMPDETPEAKITFDYTFIEAPVDTGLPMPDCGSAEPVTVYFSFVEQKPEPRRNGAKQIPLGWAERMPEGNYTLTDFQLLDSEGNMVYRMPRLPHGRVYTLSLVNGQTTLANVPVSCW